MVNSDSLTNLRTGLSVPPGDHQVEAASGGVYPRRHFALAELNDFRFPIRQGHALDAIESRDHPQSSQRRAGTALRLVSCDPANGVSNNPKRPGFNPKAASGRFARFAEPGFRNRPGAALLSLRD